MKLNEKCQMILPKLTPTYRRVANILISWLLSCHIIDCSFNLKLAVTVHSMWLIFQFPVIYTRRLF